jgi:flagellar biosynthetic protein FliQ
MNAADALDLFQQAMWLTVIGAGPAIIAASVVGVGVALFQALTQIQEATLTFIPKMIAMALVFGFTATLTGGHFSAFAEQVYLRIEKGYGR